MREQWILGISIATLLFVAAILVLVVRRHYKRSDTDVLLDAVDGARDQIDSHSQHTALEHQAILKSLDKSNGRLQWLIADKIAEELKEHRETAGKPAGPPSQDDTK